MSARNNMPLFGRHRSYRGSCGSCNQHVGSYAQFRAANHDTGESKPESESCNHHPSFQSGRWRRSFHTCPETGAELGRHAGPLGNLE